MISFEQKSQLPIEGWQLTVLVKKTRCLFPTPLGASALAASAWLSKEPVAVVLERGDDFLAFDLRGEPLTRDALKTLGWEEPVAA